MSSIPCLNYRKALEKEEEEAGKQKDLLEQQKSISNNDGSETAETPTELLSIPNAKIETVSENVKAHSLTGVQLQEYCQKLFRFKTIRVMRFKSWSARRQFTKNKRQIKNLQRPTLPDGTKLITFPVVNATADGTNNAVTGSNKKVSQGHQFPRESSQ